MSDQPAPATLAEALVALQANLPRIVKGETAEVETKTGRKYTYRYVDLASIHALILPLLAALGLCWVCRPTLSSGQFVLAYHLTHAATKQEIAGEYPLPMSGSPQELGSAITYGRRYCLTAVIGIAPDEDDDGAQGTDWHPPANPRTRKADRHRSDRSGPLPDDDWTGAAPDDTPGSITAARATELGYWFTKAGITSAKDRLAYAMSKLDRPELTGSDQLSEADGIKLAQALKDEP